MELMVGLGILEAEKRIAGGNRCISEHMRRSFLDVGWLLRRHARFGRIAIANRPPSLKQTKRGGCDNHQTDQSSEDYSRDSAATEPMSAATCCTVRGITLISC
jgi:hypothetical protein